MSTKRDPLEFLRELRERVLADEPDWILKLDGDDLKKKKSSKKCISCLINIFREIVCGVRCKATSSPSFCHLSSSKKSSGYKS
jgi:hypothetical protein